MSNLSTSGRLHQKFDAVQISERFTKREFVLVLEPDSKYPQFVMFQLTGDRCDLVDRAEVGDQVEVEFSLRGREWTSPKGEVRFFNSLDAWTVRLESKGTPAKATPPQSEPPPEDDIF